MRQAIMVPRISYLEKIAFQGIRMKLVTSLTSPYGRKVRVVLLEKKIPFQLQVENPWLPDSP